MTSAARWRHDRYPRASTDTQTLEAVRHARLEARLAQARAGQLGHLEFLQVLCEDELTRRGAGALTRKVRAARFEELAYGEPGHSL